MNMFLHNINYNDFSIKRGDTLLNPYHGEERPFDAIVSNPPYSIKWIGDADPTLINDERFAPAGKLAPKSYADYAFIMHSLSYLSSKGRAAIVCFPGIFYRKGAERTIRKYLVDNNHVSQPPIITGMDQQIATKLTSHRDMTRILGEHFDYAIGRRYHSIYHYSFGESKDMLRQVLKNYYGDRLTTEQIKKLGKLTYTGWGRLSKKFLSDIWGMKRMMTMQKQVLSLSICVRGRKILMQLLSSSYSFIDVVQEYVTTYWGRKKRQHLKC